MILMTKFGKFKLRLVASINLAVLLSAFNFASLYTKDWIKYIDPKTGVTHSAGLWQSCPIEQGECVSKYGIFEDEHSFWSFSVRSLILIGFVANFASFVFFFIALGQKYYKKSKCALKWMENGNLALTAAFIISFCGLCVFVSSKNNFSFWFHAASLVLAIVTTNMLTRAFASFYFRNARAGNLIKSIENGLSRSKIPCDPEEKVALASSENQVVTEIEMSKVKELGSNEALIPQANEPTNETPAANETVVPKVDASQWFNHDLQFDSIFFFNFKL